MSGGRDPRATAEYLQTTLGHGKAAAEKSESGLHVFATYLFTHNSRVSILSFALGFAFGVPTLMLEYYQGIGLGAMLAVFSAKGLAFDFCGWLFRSEAQTSELQSLMRISYADFCLKKKKT